MRRLSTSIIAALTLAGAAAAAAVAVPALAAGGAQASASKTIVVKNFAFKPTSLTISKGTTVTWSFQDSVGHNVTGSFGHSKTIVKGKYSFKFTKAGTFNYICTIHPFMKAKIVVH
jgi:plastocyanin